MALYRKQSMTSAVALAIALTACGGGGETHVASISTPPPPPPPPPPPITIYAAAMAAVPNANLFPQATTGGPTMQAHSTTVFPLLESVVSVSSSPSSIVLSADKVAMAGGATLEFDAPGDDYKISVPGVGIDDVTSIGGGWYCYCTPLDISSGNLSWTSYGSWSAGLSSGTKYASFVTGYATPVNSIPSTGSATFTGIVDGKVFYPGQAHIATAALSGNAALQANFGSGSITGSLTNMFADASPWNSVSLAGTIAGGQNFFSGTSAATSAPAGAASLSGSATGTLAGVFFGPSAQELGAIWTLFDGRSTAIGSIAATTSTSGGGPWDY